ncbi:MAG: hypothetical protein GX561_15085 [Lentisphaerae bacterium]|jgi:hypothetical protein|nr:hypothetical protein [Lentisphaerota bacterium]
MNSRGRILGIMAVVCLVAASMAFGEVVCRLDVPGESVFKPKIFGDNRGHIMEATEASPCAFMYTPQATSWAYLVADFKGGELGEGDYVVVEAWLTTSRGEMASILISEKATIGDYCPTLTNRRIKLAGRQKATIVHKVKDPTAWISVGVGLDYGATNGILQVEKIRCVKATGLVEDSFEPLPANELQLPQLFLRGITESLTRLDCESFVSEGVSIKGLDSWRERLQLTLLKFEAFSALMPFRAGMYPSGGSGEIACIAPLGGRDEKLLLLRNECRREQTFTLDVRGALRSVATLRRLYNVDQAPDCPRPLGLGELVEASSESTTGFMLEFSTEGLEAGEYEGEIVLTPCDISLQERVLPCKLTVVPASLPEDMPIPVFSFEYNHSANPETMKLMLDMRINTFAVDLHRPGDFKNLHNLVKTMDSLGVRDRVKLIFVENHFLRLKHWREEDAVWLDQLVVEMERAGFKYEQWVLHIYDEVLHEQFHRAAAEIKKRYPMLMIFTDALGSDPSNASVDLMEMMRPVIDYWCPHMHTFTSLRKTFEPTMKYARTTGLPIFLYNCDSMPRAALKPARMISWYAFSEKLDGICYWSLIVSRFRFEGRMNYGLSYMIDGTMFPSRRWYQWCSGLEDYLILLQASKVNEKKARALASEVLSKYDKSDLPQVHERVRRELLDMLK